jgi:hypothetical protein
VPLLDATTATLGRKPREVSADAGFCRESNLAALAARRIRGYLAPGRAAYGSADPRGRRRLMCGWPPADKGFSASASMVTCGHVSGL